MANFQRLEIWGATLAIALGVGATPAVAQQTWQLVGEVEGTRYSVGNVEAVNSSTINFDVLIQYAQPRREIAYGIAYYTGNCGSNPAQMGYAGTFFYNAQNFFVGGDDPPSVANAYTQPQAGTLGGAILTQACSTAGRSVNLRR